MSKRFKAKKRKKFGSKIVWYFVFFLIVFFVFSAILKHFKLATTNEEFIEHLLEDSNYHLKYNQVTLKLATNLSNVLASFKVNEPVTILEKSLGYQFTSSNQPVEKNNQSNMVFHKNNVDDLILPERTRVYIYSTHYKEGYVNANLEDYNITPNVTMASMLLKERLNKLGIPTVVEEGDIEDFMAVNNWNYLHSYEASRYFVKDMISKNPDLELIIDFHRDAVSKSSSTTQIDGKSYAKILFVCGKENPNYEKNLAFMNRINDKIKEKYPTLTRGIMIHDKNGYNGVYNQDLSPNMILLECGGHENNIGEVTNTITALAPIIAEILNES